MLGVASIAVATWSVFHGGIAWDTRNDTNAALATQAVDSSWSLAEAYAFVPGTSEFYGVFLQQLADALHVLTTGSLTHLRADEPVTYVYQGLANLILAVGSVTALAVALAVATRSLLAAAFAWSLTLATPLWLGMSHVDFKDMPVAAGLTLVTAGLVLSVSLERPARATIVGAALAGAGGAVALATRAGSLLLLVALAGGAAAAMWAVGRRSGAPFGPVAVTSGSALVFALAFTWATNPIPRIATLAWLMDATDIARSFPWGGPIRTAGRDLLSVDLPWWYVPAWLGAQLPLLTLASLVGGLVVLIIAFVRRSTAADTRTALALVPIALQALVVPVLIVASGAVLYDGIRHLLFMLPALMAMPAVALAVLVRQPGLRPSIAAVLPVCAVVVVVASLLASIRWAPYAYAYINPIAGSDRDGRSWELDYAGVSGREGVRRLHELGYSSVEVQPSDGVGIPWGARASLANRGPETALYVFLRYNRAADFGCTVVFTIERGGHTLGEGARCPAGTTNRP